VGQRREGERKRERLQKAKAFERFAKMPIRFE